MTATHRALNNVSSPLRRWTRFLWFTGGVGLAFGAIGIMTWLAWWGVVQSPLWVVWAWGVAIGGVGLVLWRAYGALRQLDLRPLATRLEKVGGWRHGTLTSLLESSGEGTSPELLAEADRLRAREIAEHGPSALHAQLTGVRARVRLFGGVVLIGTVMIVMADPINGTAAELWAPGAALDRYLAPVRLTPDRTEVDLGDTVVVLLEAPGRGDVILATRAPGEVWKDRAVQLDSTSRATLTLGPLRSDLLLRAFGGGGGRASDTTRIHVRVPAFLARLELIAEYPAYLQRDSEPLSALGEPLTVPAGTLLRSRGEATAPLQSGRWTGPLGATEVETQGATFAGAFLPTKSGEYRLELLTRDGVPLAGDGVLLPIQVVADSAPTIEIPSPGLDTAVVLEQIIPIVVDARDDHLLRRVTVEMRRRPRGSVPDSTVRLTLPLPSGGADRVIIPSRLVLDALAASPGDTITYRALAEDNAPSPHVSSSRVHVLILPTSRGARTERGRASDAIRRQLDSLIADSRSLERQAEALSRAQARGPQPGGAPEAGRQLTFEETKRAEGVVQDQEQLLAEAESLERSLQELADAADRAGIGDSAWERRLQEIRDELRRALSPELKERLAELQQALDSLDAGRAQQALKQLAEAQRALREALERSRELFKRAALEGELASLEQEAKEVAEAQREAVEAMQAGDSAAAANEQTLAARADTLASGLDQAAARMEQDSSGATLQATAEQARAAAEAMRKAAQAGRQGQQQQAEQHGQQAASDMSKVEKAVQDQREAQQQEWREEVVRALDRALAEASRLADRQLSVAEQMQRGRPTAELRREQASVQEGVQQLLEQVKTASGQNALVSPRIGTTLTAAAQQMGRARSAISTASPNMREAGIQAGEAVDALNMAAYQLLRSRGDVSGSSSGSGLAEALERMAQLAQQQGALSQQAGGLLPLAGQSAIQQELQALAGQQRAAAQELERVRALGQLPGADQLAREAEDLARRLEAGRLDRETVARQERLFQRMLDAGRTLQGEEKDDSKERRSETPDAIAPFLPPDLDPRVREHLRWPTWEELLRLSPDQRRWVADYFRRLSTRP